MAQRAAPPKVNPATAGQIGGQYRPLSEADLKGIYQTALRLLSDLGMGEVPDRLRDDLVAAGAIATDNGRVSFPNALVEDAIAMSVKTFVLHGRDPEPGQQLHRTRPRPADRRRRTAAGRRSADRFDSCVHPRRRRG